MVCESTGNKDSRKSLNVSSKPEMGIKGIRFSTKTKKGKSAIKKLNAMLPALVVRAPLKIPVIYISIKS
jgi:hypothetical protein